MWKSLILNIQFMTRIPIPIQVEADEDTFAKGIVFFPFIGLIVGTVTAVVYYLASFLVPGMPAAFMAVAAGIVMTGGIHLDGLSDTCDGIFSARSKERMLEIMKDSRLGTFGGVALILDIVGRISFIADMNPAVGAVALITAPVIAKSMTVLLIRTSKNAREGGMGNFFLGRTRWNQTAIALLSGLLFVLWIGGFKGGAIFALSIGVICLYKILVYKKIGGMTGDTLGAGSEVIELFVLLAFSAMAAIAKVV